MPGRPWGGREGSGGEALAGALLTDLYELTMAASYLRQGMVQPATFSLTVRRLPPQRGFLVAAGIEDCLDFLASFHFREDELAYLGREGFDEATLRALSRLRFTGYVRAVAEGRVVLAEEPILEVTAPLPEAQLVETYLLNQVTYQTTLAAKAVRCRLAAAGRIELSEFGLRRTHGAEAGMKAARIAAMVGFGSTSNVEAARRYGIPTAGTMAHSYVEAFPTELEAFQAFAADPPARPTFLIDTYDTRVGVEHAIQVIQEAGLGDVAGVRIDSGDLVGLSFEVRRRLDAAGLPRVRIIVSGGLDEHDLAQLVARSAPVDAVGLGTRVGVSADAPFLDSAYKLVEFQGRPVAKLSTGKATYPGAKQVFRSAGLRDRLGLAGEETPAGAEALLETRMSEGRRLEAGLEPGVSIARARACLERDLDSLPPGALRLEAPEPPLVEISEALQRLTSGVRRQLAAVDSDPGR